VIHDSEFTDLGGNDNESEDTSDSEESSSCESDDSKDETYDPKQERLRVRVQERLRVRVQKRSRAGKMKGSTQLVGKSLDHDTHDTFTDWCEKPRPTHTTAYVIHLISQ